MEPPPRDEMSAKSASPPHDEQPSDDDDDLFNLDALLKEAAANYTAKASNCVDADQAKSVELSKTVVAIASRKGGLARDNLPEIVRSVTGGEKGFMQYLDKGAAELKGAAYIIISPKGADLLLAAKETDGVRWLTEDAAETDPTFAERNDGVRVLVVRHVPKDFDVTKEAHLNFYADWLGHSLCDLMGKMGQAMVKAGVIDGEEQEQYDDVGFEVKNVETVSTFGKNYTHKALKDRIYIVIKFFPRATPTAVFKPKFIPHMVQIGERLKLVTKSVEGKEVVGPEMEGAFNITTQQEHYGLMFTQFCPYHGVTTHGGDMCSKWLKVIKARRIQRAAMTATANERARERKEKYESAASSSRTTSRW